ncbi:lipid IV(A) 3-deoxy-D-manno-octulosonic acid transferase [Vibrio echinoideorum]|uniref:lipid IV(A) 3-deoxy-D-manno-octulosonic acid transferase n=1 Tax=Vibrio echinoideorum TaxID=2100116 RepID=UPI003552284E
MIIRFIYTALLTLAAPFLLYSLYRSHTNRPAYGERWTEHFGITPKLTTNHRPIWIHAVSVGESIAATALIKELKKRHPKQTILVTTTTSTGAEQIEKLGDLVEHRYMPIDFGFAVKGFLKAVNPTQMLIIETELWPNTLHQVSKFGVPITVVNARLSEKSRNNYSKFHPVFNIIEPCLTNILCQTKSDAARFERLGVDKNKLAITGSIKFDIQISDEVREKGKTLRKELGESRPIWIAASTHKGEDEQVLKAHEKVLESHPNALLILVPRHPERFDSVFELSNNANFNSVRRTSNHTITAETQVYLGDTMGEMLILMRAADVCFMGGSLLGDKVGGHNVLEPIALEVPVIIGPSYFNFKSIVDELIQVQGITIIRYKSEIAKSVSSYFKKNEDFQGCINNSLSVISHNIGALSKTISILDNQ